MIRVRAPRASAASTSSRVQLLALAGSLVVVLAGCGGDTAGRAGLAAADGSSGSFSPPVDPVPVDPVPVVGPLSSRIVLAATDVVAGESLQGAVEVTNNGSAPVSVPSAPGGCRPKWAVGLANDKISFDPVFTADCGLEPLVFPPGRTELPVTVSTRSSACTGSPAGGSGQPARCAPDGGTPALPPGDYQAEFFSGDPELPVPVPVPVRVLPA